MKFNARNELDKVVTVGDSNGGGAPNAEAIFTVFSKKYALHTLV